MERLRPKRELVAEVDAVLDGFHWSEWHAVVSPMVNGTWFFDTHGKPASIKQINRETLATTASGVYEVCISTRRAPRRMICIYAGRAIDAASVGCNLRKRLGGYIKNGGDLSPELSYFLRLGCTMHVRWALFGPIEPTKEAERKLLDAFDYALNKQNNGEYRPVHTICWTDTQTVHDAIREQEKQAEMDAFVRSFSQFSLDDRRLILEELAKTTDTTNK